MPKIPEFLSGCWPPAAHWGGVLSRAADDAIHIMEAMGKDIIIVETFGIGQQEIDIINHAHSVMVVIVPGMGDEVQIMKVVTK